MRRGSLISALSLLLAAPVALHGQATGTVEGTVLDSTTASPLAGVTVSIPELEIASLTGPEGRYTLTGVPAGEHAVLAQLIGYGVRTETVQVVSDQAATLDFGLVSEAIELEAIVAVGYGTQHVRDLTGAISSVGAEDLRQVATPHSLEAIKGRAAGVDIVSDGHQPGDDVRMVIRGTRSITAENEPLYVIDGIPVHSGLGDFNLADIESIEILKDASATAIYGSRGANGVVLITTDRGLTTGTRVTYDTYYGFESPRGRIDMMDADDFAQLKREAYRAAGRYNCPDGTDMRLGCPEGDQGIFEAGELAALESGQSTDWTDLISRQGAQQNHVLNISGGTDRTRFSVSGSYFDQRGITRGMDYTRMTASANVDHQFSRFSIGVASNFTHSVRNLGGGNGIWGQAMAHNPMGAPFFDDGTPNPQPVSDGLLWNPLLTLDNVADEQTRYRVFGSVWAEIELADGIRFRSNFGPDLLHVFDGGFAGSNSGTHRASGNATADLFRDQRLSYTFSNFLTIDREIFDHRVNTTLLYEVQSADIRWGETFVSQLPYEHQRWNNLGSAGMIEGVTSGLEEWMLQSFMGRVNYSFRDRYLVTLTGRLDGSSRLAEGNRYGFFPSAAVAWWLSDEAFVRNLGLFDDLKLRVSYGLTANTAIDPYQTQSDLAHTTYSFEGQPAFGFRPNRLPNPELGWEKTRSLDIGLDFAVLNDRLSGTADFYVQNTYDLLMERQLPFTTGYGSVLENVGETRNTGIELSLSTVNINRPDGLTWTTDISWTRNRNEIVSLFGDREDDIGNAWFIGHPIDVYYDHVFDGIWQSHEAEEAAGYGQEPGDIKVVDRTGDGQISGDDRDIIGRHERHPSWFGSLNNRFQWGRFDLTVLAVARWGYMLSSDFHAESNSLFGRYNNIRTSYWTPENPSNDDPRPNREREWPLYNESRMYKDGSHVRIRTISLGYQVPDTWVARFGGQSLRLYATAQDPYIFTSYDGFDPESNQAGGTGAGSPAYRTLLIGASVGF
jgi:TonB-linked SusC/RagA family outer membrane protein